jgi:hypothetical protein
VSVSAALHATIKKSRPSNYYAVGELRGVLGQITVHRNKHEFAIYDPLTDRPIICVFDDEPRKIADLITRRVAVSGRIEYDRHTDDPVKVTVESWQAIRPEDELASLEDIRNAMQSLPAGQTSEGYVRNQRDDD